MDNSKDEPTAADAASLICLYKLAVLLLAVLTLELVPAFSEADFHAASRRWPMDGNTIDWTTQVAAWDGAHYLYLAEVGYERGSPSCAFYPLWPLLIRLGKYLTLGDPVVAGLILANGFSIAGLWLFYRLVAGRHGAEVGFLALAFLLAFPGAIFFSVIYTEPLFFLLTMVFFLGLFQEKPGWVAITGFLLPLTRAVGVFLLLPLAWRALEKAWHDWQATMPLQGKSWKRLLRLVLVRREVWAMGAVLAGYATFFGIMYESTGNAFEAFAAQKHYANQPSIGNILNVAGFAKAFIHIDGLHTVAGSVFDRALFVLFLVCLPAIWRLDRLYFWYALGTGLVPAMSNWFFSYNRFFILCFPVFIVLARKWRGAENLWLRWLVVVLAGTVQVIFLIRYLNFFWTG
jgi:hypothetical protein